MSQLVYSDREIADVLGEARVFAFVGASANPVRPSAFAMKYLLAKGYIVHPVNPGLAGQEVFGHMAYAKLAHVPGPVDVVDIFRNAEAAAAIVDEAIALKDTLSIKTIWMQLGVVNAAAAERARAAGLGVIMDRCPKIEYGRLSGEIGWMGTNLGKVTSRRPLLAPGGVQRQVLRRG